MVRDPHPQTEVLRLQLRHDGLLDVAAEAVRAAGTALGLAVREADGLARAARTSCAMLARAGFDDPGDVDVDLTLLEGPTGLAVRVTDNGLPFALHRDTGDGRLAERLARRLTAEVGGGDPSVSIEHVTLTDDADGTTVVLHTRAGSAGTEHLASEEATGVEPVAADAPVTVRALREDDTESLARCVWRVYRHTYVADYLYHPERVWSLVTEDRLRSWVAVDPVGEVVGHIGLLLDGPDTTVGDLSLALTDPRYRHHHVMEQIAALMEKSIGTHPLTGTFAEAVTAHTITQRLQVRAGSIETGVLLGFIPASMSYRGIQEDLGGNRQSAVLSYRPRRPAPPRTVALPTRYADELRRAFTAAGLDRAEAPAVAGPGSTRATIELDRPRGLATVVVQRAGGDLVEVIDRQRRALCAAGSEIVYAELPLSDPGSAVAVDDLVDRGFFYAGVIPELRNGDVLRLQYLDVDVDPTVIQLYSDEARRLLEMTLADRS
jgi:serine/threonine-protein kinase RsbW